MEKLYVAAWIVWAGIKVHGVYKAGKDGFAQGTAALMVSVAALGCILAQNLSMFVAANLIGLIVGFAMSIDELDRKYNLSTGMFLSVLALMTVGSLLLNVGMYLGLIWLGSQIGAQPIIF